VIKAAWERLRQSMALYLRFAELLREHRFAMGLVLSLVLATVALELLKPWPIQWIIDSALIGEPTGGLTRGDIILRGALMAAALVALDVVLDYWAAIKTAEIGQSVVRRLRGDLFAHMLRLSPKFHARHKTGDLLVRIMGDVPLVRTVLVDSSVAMASRVLLVLGTVIAMAWVDWRTTLVVLAVVPAFMLVLRIFSKRLTIQSRKQREKEGELADSVHESLSATPTLQALGTEEEVGHMFARQNRRSARAELKSARLSARMGGSMELLFGVCTAAALWVGSTRVAEGALSTGELLVFVAYVRSLLKPVRATSKHSERWSKGIACAERLSTILDEPIAIVSGPEAIQPAARPQTLQFMDVRFAYEGQVEALRGFSATFQRGQLAGLFGRSGSGKSTVAALTARLYDPDAGEVLLDGVDLRKHDLRALRASSALALQENVLFGMSLRDNLLLGQAEATDDQLHAALRAAGAAEFVARLPHGLDTELGSSGTGLSGGERRRICLARTLLRPAPVLVVDEPFAGLDAVAVEIVMRTLRERSQDSIVIVIAHDLDRLDRFDTIVYIEQGVVRDAGRHHELQARCTSYRESIRSMAS
jgi:ABC-type branched-subunit amino acid transport system ATPase component